MMHADSEAYSYDEAYSQSSTATVIQPFECSHSMHAALQYLTEHGVTLDFALRIFATPREDMWWPDRKSLMDGGVIATR